MHSSLIAIILFTFSISGALAGDCTNDTNAKSLSAINIVFDFKNQKSEATFAGTQKNLQAIEIIEEKLWGIPKSKQHLITDQEVFVLQFQSSHWALAKKYYEAVSEDPSRSKEFSEEQIKQLKNARQHSPREAFLAALDEKLEVGQKTMIYLTSHGTTDSYLDHLKILVPIDFPELQSKSIDDNAVSFKDLQTFADRAPTGWIIDACESGAMECRLSERMTQKDFFLMAASLRTQKAVDTEHGSLFTKALLDVALAKAPDICRADMDKDGEMSERELALLLFLKFSNVMKLPAVTSESGLTDEQRNKEINEPQLPFSRVRNQCIIRINEHFGCPKPVNKAESLTCSDFRSKASSLIQSISQFRKTPEKLQFTKDTRTTLVPVREKQAIRDIRKTALDFLGIWLTDLKAEAGRVCGTSNNVEACHDPNAIDELSKFFETTKESIKKY